MLILYSCYHINIVTIIKAAQTTNFAGAGISNVEAYIVIENIPHMLQVIYDEIENRRKVRHQTSGVQ